LDMTVAFLNSFRHFNPLIPLCLVPYNDVDIQKLRRLASVYNFQECLDQKLFETIDRATDEIMGDDKPRHDYRKLAIWSGPFEEFLFIEVDTVVLDNIDFAWPLLEFTDVATAASMTGNNQRGSVTADIVSPEQTDSVGETGVILSSKRFATAEALLNRTIVEAKQNKKNFKMDRHGHQLLNYVLVMSGKRYNSFSRMVEVSRKDVPKLEAAADNGSVSVTDDHRVRWKDTERSNLGIFLLHWAGWRKRSSQMPFYELWKYWHDLKYQRPSEKS